MTDTHKLLSFTLTADFLAFSLTKYRSPLLKEVVMKCMFYLFSDIWDPCTVEEDSGKEKQLSQTASSTSRLSLATVCQCLRLTPCTQVITQADTKLTEGGSHISTHPPPWHALSTISVSMTKACSLICTTIVFYFATHQCACAIYSTFGKILE